MAVGLVTSQAMLFHTLSTLEIDGTVGVPAFTSEATATADAEAGGTPGAGLTKDLVGVLRDLVSGDVSGSKKTLDKVTAGVAADDLGESAEVGAVATLSPLQKILGRIASALSLGDKSGALGALAGLLVQRGQVSGVLVDVRV